MVVNFMFDRQVFGNEVEARENHQDCAEQNIKTGLHGKGKPSKRKTYRLLMFFDASFECRDIALGVIIEAIQVLFSNDREVCPRIQFSCPNVMAPEYGRCRHCESRMARSKSRLLPSQKFSTLNGVILTDYAIDGKMQHMIFLMTLALWCRDFDDLVYLSLARPERFFSMLRL